MPFQCTVGSTPASCSCTSDLLAGLRGLSCLAPAVICSALLACWQCDPTGAAFYGLLLCCACCAERAVLCCSASHCSLLCCLLRLNAVLCVLCCVVLLFVAHCCAGVLQAQLREVESEEAGNDMDADSNRKRKELCRDGSMTGEVCSRRC